jgi:hypothetical protein
MDGSGIERRILSLTRRRRVDCSAALHRSRHLRPVPAVLRIVIDRERCEPVVGVRAANLCSFANGWNVRRALDGVSCDGNTTAISRPSLVANQTSFGKSRDEA